MKKKYNILLTQVNYQYGNNVFVPYSIGSIQAYSETISEIRNNFQFQKPIFLRENLNDVILKIQTPDVAGFSCYLWNWEYNNMLAKLIKAKFPQCLVVFGGPEVPNISENFFIDYPYVDILVHNEGEFSFSEILLEYLSEKPDYTKISGLSIRVSNNKTLKTNVRGRILDLSQLPSPYLSGIFDFLLDKQFILNVCQETNRGCPYECQYCDWGGSTHNKIIPIEESRILAELEWFGQHHVEYLFSCDSNYGILARDRDLVVKMIEIRKKYNGYPKRFRMCTAKNSNDEIFAMTKILTDAGMNKGATLSFQSMNDDTLEIIKRRNIKIADFSSLMKKYCEAGISTYTELIIGLPGETYKTTKKGIDTLIDAQEDSINIYAYVCIALPNSEMSKVSFKKQYGIKTVRTPILLVHSTPSKDSVMEYNNIVIETSSMTKEDWFRTYIFYLVVQCFYCLGLTRHISILFRRQLGVNYSDFYERLILYFNANDKTLVGEQLVIVSEIVEKAMYGGRLDLVIPKFGNIYWPLEEAVFLNLIVNKEKFYREIKSFVRVMIQDLGRKVEDDLLDDLISYQSSVIIDPFTLNLLVEFRYDLYNYFNKYIDKSYDIKHLSNKLIIKAEQDFSGNLGKYSREVVWYGRKSGKFHHTNIIMQVV